MSLIVIDVEADGPYPGGYSMISFGAVLLSDTNVRFHGLVRPISDHYLPDVLAISDTTREQHLTYPDPAITLAEFERWLQRFVKGRPIMISDNPAFDWQWINYYFWHFLNRNPLGFSARRIGDLYAGLMKDAFLSNDWKRFRRTPHTHNPVDDALGNAEALLEFKKLGLKI